MGVARSHECVDGGCAFKHEAVLRADSDLVAIVQQRVCTGPAIDPDFPHRVREACPAAAILDACMLGQHAVAVDTQGAAIAAADQQGFVQTDTAPVTGPTHAPQYQTEIARHGRCRRLRQRFIGGIRRHQQKLVAIGVDAIAGAQHRHLLHGAPVDVNPRQAFRYGQPDATPIVTDLQQPVVPLAQIKAVALPADAVHATVQCKLFRVVVAKAQVQGFHCRAI